MQTPQSERALFALLAAEFGAPAVVRLKRAMERPATDRGDDFYTLKNENPALSARLTTLFDGQTLPQFIDFLQTHRQLLGKTVLDVGCDNGLLTAEIARLSPESAVTGFDRNAAAIAAARAQSAQSGAVFVDQMPTGMFSAALSLRTLHENFDQSGVAALERLPETAARLAARMVGHARLLTGFVAPDGYLISIERCHADGVLLGWLLALDALGFSQIAHQRITTKECGVAAEFHAMVFCRACVAGARTVTERFVQEQLTLDSLEATLLPATEQFSFELCGPDGARHGWSGAWRLADGSLLAVQATVAAVTEKRFPALQTPAILAALRASMDSARRAGYQIRTPAQWNLL